MPLVVDPALLSQARLPHRITSWASFPETTLLSAPPIQQRFLIPVVTVVAAALAASAAITAVWLHTSIQRRDQHRLERVVATLTAPGFPLNEPVLAKMSGLSGADFVVLDDDDRPIATTLLLGEKSLAGLLRSLAQSPAGGQAVKAVVLGDREYLAEAIQLPPSVAAGQHLIVLSPVDQLWASTLGVVLPPVVVGLVACVLLVVVVSAIARHTARPIQQLAAHAVRIASGDFSRSATQPGCQELDVLAAAMNDMAGRLREYADRIRRNERLRTLDQLSGGIAHQLRNAATGARLALDLYRRDAAEPDCEPLAVAHQQLQQIEACCQRFLSLARGGQPHETRSFEHLALDKVVREACSMVMPLVEHAGATIEVLADDNPLELCGDGEGLRQVVTNLLVNAVEAVRHPDIVEKRLAVEVCRCGSSLQMRVGDTGPGPAVAVGDVFEPLVSDKAEGTGLGLALVREVVAAHGGSVSWRRDEGWTWFEIEFPTSALSDRAGQPARLTAASSTA